MTSDEQPNTSPANQDSPLPTQTVGVTPTSQQGLPKRIGQFHVKRRIAQGGMGAVYEAFQEHPRRTVALKVMKHGVTSKSALRRFEYESQILARLRHPNIAQVYEAGTFDDGGTPVPFFAMEYIVNAKSITEYAQVKKLTLKQRMELFANVCDAVHHGHQKGIIHRDLKPGNILVDSHGEVKVIDFGVARGTDSDMAVTTLQTDIGQLVGTLQYMSPEQVEGDPQDLDTRSDVYSLGIVMYELLSGKLPYDVSRAKLFDSTRVIREKQPPRLSTIDSSLRGDVETIVFKALEKDRDRRYQSASALFADIHRYLTNQPIAARPASIGYQLRILARRHKVLFAATATVALVLVVGVIVSSTLYVRAKRSEAKATAINNFLVKDVLGAANPNVAQGRTITAKDLLDSAAKKIDKAFKDQPEIEASLRATIGRTYSNLGLYDKAEAQLDAALTIQRSVLGEHDPATLRTRYLRVALENDRGHFSAAEAELRDLLETQRELLGEAHKDTIATMNVLANALSGLEKTDEAAALWKRALELAIDTTGDESEQSLIQMNNYAIVLRDTGKTNEAEKLWYKALRVGRRVLGEKHPFLSAPLLNLGVIQFDRGDFLQAETLLRQSYQLNQSVLGDRHPDTLKSTDQFASVLVDIGRGNEAKKIAESTLQMAQEVLGADHRTTIGLLHTVGLVELRSGGGFDKINDAFERAKRVFGEEDRDYLNIALTHCDALLQHGRDDEAEALARRTLPVAQRVLGKSSQITLYLLSSHVYSLSQLGKLSQAESELNDLLQRGAESSQNKQLSLESAADCANRLSEALFIRDPEKAEQLLGDILTQIDRSGVEFYDAIVSVRDKLAVWQLEMGKTQTAMATIKRAVAASRQAGIPPDSVWPLSMGDTLSRVLLEQGQVIQAQRESRHAVSVGRQSLGSNDDSIFIWIAQLIDTLSVQGQIDRLEPSIIKDFGAMLDVDRQHALITSVVSPYDQGEALVLWQEASPSDRRAEVLAALTKGVDLVGRKYPPLLTLLARMQALNGDVSSAADTLQQALATEVGGPFRTRIALRNVGYLRTLDRQQEADVVLASLRTRLATDLNDHRQAIIEALIDLGLQFLAPSDAPLLQSICRQLNYVAKHYDSHDHDDVVPLMVFRAKILLDKRDYKQAKAILERCITIRQLTLAADDPRIAKASSMLVQAQTALGKHLDPVTLP